MRTVGQVFIERLVAAWNNQGPFPKYHLQAKKELRDNWPFLYEAIELIVREADRA